MNKNDFKQAIANKRKGILLPPKEQAEMLDMALSIGEGILDKQKEIEEDKALIADLKVHFPVIYREAHRIFTKKPTE